MSRHSIGILRQAINIARQPVRLNRCRDRDQRHGAREGLQHEARAFVIAHPACGNQHDGRPADFVADAMQPGVQPAFRAADTAGKNPSFKRLAARRLIATEIPDKVAANQAYQNAKAKSDKQNARVEHDKPLAGIIVGLMKDGAGLFRQFSDNPEFRRRLSDTIFTAAFRLDPSQASISDSYRFRANFRVFR